MMKNILLVVLLFLILGCKSNQTPIVENDHKKDKKIIKPVVKSVPKKKPTVKPTKKKKPIQFKFDDSDFANPKKLAQKKKQLFAIMHKSHMQKKRMKKLYPNKFKRSIPLLKKQYNDKKKKLEEHKRKDGGLSELKRRANRFQIEVLIYELKQLKELLGIKEKIKKDIIL